MRITMAQLRFGSLCAAALALGVAICTHPANAEPNDAELDVGAYDECYQKGFGQGLDEDEFFTHAATCCVEAGGTWNDSTYNCQAPPAQPAEIRPGFNLPPGFIVPEQTLTPVPATTVAPALPPTSRG